VKVENGVGLVKVEGMINGRRFSEYVSPAATLLQLIRDTLCLNGTKQGCGEGECGACTVIMNGEAVRSCIILAAEADGAVITTVEALASPDGTLHPVQSAFLETGAVQCGFCTPGMLMATKALLDETHEPQDEDIRRAMSGHLCRCTGYKPIADAIKLAARAFRSGKSDV